MRRDGGARCSGAPPYVVRTVVMAASLSPIISACRCALSAASVAACSDSCAAREFASLFASRRFWLAVFFDSGIGYSSGNRIRLRSVIEQRRGAYFASTSPWKSTRKAAASSVLSFSHARVLALVRVRLSSLSKTLLISCFCPFSRSCCVRGLSWGGTIPAAVAVAVTAWIDMGSGTLRSAS
jgi:hypothetical protein